MANLAVPTDEFNFSDLESLPSAGDIENDMDYMYAQTIDMDYLDEQLYKLVNDENTKPPDAQVEVVREQEKKTRGKRGPDKKKRIVKKGFQRTHIGKDRKYVMVKPRGPRGPYKRKTILILNNPSLIFEK